jgi:hypothetical protein
VGPSRGVTGFLAEGHGAACGELTGGKGRQQDEQGIHSEEECEAKKMQIFGI